MFVVRHLNAPTINGCRRCGNPFPNHGWKWAGGRTHRYEPPTFAQRAARLAAHLYARKVLEA